MSGEAERLQGAAADVRGLRQQALSAEAPLHRLEVAAEVRESRQSRDAEGRHSRVLELRHRHRPRTRGRAEGESAQEERHLGILVERDRLEVPIQRRPSRGRGFAHGVQRRLAHEGQDLRRRRPGVVRAVGEAAPDEGLGNPRDSERQSAGSPSGLRFDGQGGRPQPGEGAQSGQAGRVGLQERPDRERRTRGGQGGAGG